MKGGMNDTSGVGSHNPLDIASEPEQLNLRQREVIALEAIAKTLEQLLIEFEGFAQYMRSR